MRFNETVTDKVVDQLPARLWPHLQPYFLAVAAAILALELGGFGFALWRRLSAFSGVAYP